MRNVTKGVKNFRAKHGVNSVGYYIDMYSNVTINNVPYYKIKFYWEKPDGTRMNSTSDSDYTHNEAQYFCTQGKFRIRSKGDNAVIVEQPFEMIEKSGKPFELLETADLPDTNEPVYCEYCGCYLKAEDSKCPNCGAPVKKSRAKK